MMEMESYKEHFQYDDGRHQITQHKRFVPYGTHLNFCFAKTFFMLGTLSAHCTQKKESMKIWVNRTIPFFAIFILSICLLTTAILYSCASVPPGLGGMIKGIPEGKISVYVWAFAFCVQNVLEEVLGGEP